MGFIGVIAFLIIGIIIYNIWFNTKYSEGEQIIMRHKAEKKRQEQVAAKNKSQWENSINENFTKNQKLAILSTLQMISLGGSNNKNTPKRIEQIVMITKKQLGFGITNEERGNYEIRLNPTSLQNTMNSLDGLARELFLSDVFNLLLCGGEPSEREFLIAANASEKIAGISSTEFENSIEKIGNMSNYFS